MKNKNKNKNSEKAIKLSVGRPEKAIKWPTTKYFTMDDMVKANLGICSKLCIIQHLQRDAKLGKKSMIVKTDEKRDNASGRGRKLEVYMKRAKVADIKPVTTTKQYEAMKAALATPAPVIETTAPVAIADIPAIDTVATPDVVAEVVAEPVPVTETPVIS